MSVFTTLWNLLKKNPATDGADTFNIETMLNDNWDKIDAALGLKAINAEVRAATTANITISGLQTVDGVALAAGDRVLVKNQTTASQNGIYTAAEGTWTRAADADQSGKLASGLSVFVKEGTSNGKKQWRLSTTGSIVLGTTALTFELVGGAGSATDAVVGNRTITDTTAPAGDSGTLTGLFGGLGYMIKAITGKSSWRTAPATTLEAAKGHMDATTGAHGATAAATANAIMQRDAAGRAKVAAPSASDDIARKAEVDAAITSAATDATAKTNAVQANLSAHVGSGGAAHAEATTSVAGFMSAEDKSKLDGISTGANNYLHPTGDGNLHVPATGTTNNAKVLKAGSTAGSAAWGNVAFSEVTGKPTTLSGYGITDAAPSSHIGSGGTAHAAATASTAGFMSAGDKSKLDGITAGAAAGTATPLMDGTAAVGTSTAYARQDHRHPTDTTRAPLASPTFSGKVTLGGDPTATMHAATKQYVDNVPYNVYRQAIINGNFDIWQRGTTFTNPAQSIYTADRWRLDRDGSGELGSFSRQLFAVGQSVVPNNPKYYARRQVTTAATSQTYNVLTHRIEGVNHFAGMQVTLSFWAKADATRTIGISFGQYFGTGGTASPTNWTVTENRTLTTSWQKITATYTIPSISGKVLGTNGDDFLQLTVGFPINTTFTIDIAQVQVNAGDTALPFLPRGFAEELALCKRYFEKSYNQADAPSTSTSFGAHGFEIRNTSSSSYEFLPPVRFSVTKRMNPTITTYSTTGAGGNGANGKVRDTSNGVDKTVAISEQSENGFTLYFNNQNVTVGADILWQWTADAEL